MLVGRRPSFGKSGLRSRCAVICLVVLFVSVLSLTPYLGSSTELVRMRNALLVIDDSNQRFDWTPDTLPPDFKQEHEPPAPLFVQAAEKLGLAGMDSDWAKVSAISRHLLSNPNLVGTPIQSDLGSTYRHIIEDGTGYCGDFTRVFMAFANTAGIPVRAWSFSFDGFGGHGHIWPEIWNRQLHQWQLIDIFNNYVITSSDGKPLSALAFRRSMQETPELLHLVPLVPGARPGYPIEEKAWDYYRRGLAEWYLSWGNNVFSYDHALLVRLFGPVSRSLEQLGGIAQGVYPRIRIPDAPTNRTQVSKLIRLRYHLLVAGVASLAALVTLGMCLVSWALGRQHHPKVVRNG